MSPARFPVITAILLGLSNLWAQAPKTWDAKALADWATPVAGLNLRPGHHSEEEYYRAPVDNFRTYPVYYPGREPEGYWEMLQKVGPKPLIEPETLKTDADWIRAGKRVFEEYDIPAFRTYGSKVIASARSPKTFDSSFEASPGRNPARDALGSHLTRVGTEFSELRQLSHENNARRERTPRSAAKPKRGI